MYACMYVCMYVRTHARTYHCQFHIPLFPPLCSPSITYNPIPCLHIYTHNIDSMIQDRIDWTRIKYSTCIIIDCRRIHVHVQRSDIHYMIDHFTFTIYYKCLSNCEKKFSFCVIACTIIGVVRILVLSSDPANTLYVRITLYTITAITSRALGGVSTVRYKNKTKTKMKIKNVRINKKTKYVKKGNKCECQ